MVATVADLSLIEQARVIAGRDLVRERRRGEVAWVIVPFGAIAMMLIPLGIGIDTPTLRRIGPGLFWVVVLLFGVLVTVRRTAADGPAERALLLRFGVDPVAELWGRTAAHVVLLLVFQVVVGLVTVVLYDVDVSRWPVVAILLPLIALGLALLGTITGGVAAATGGSNLVPFLVAPLAIPLLLAATESIDGSTTTRGILGWLLLIVLVDTILAVAGVLTARPLQEIT